DPHPNYDPPRTLTQLAWSPDRLVGAPLRMAGRGVFQLIRLLFRGVRWAVSTAMAIAILVIGVAYVASDFEWPEDTKPGGTVASTSPAPQTSAAYAQGVADWRSLQAWVDGQTGDRRAGADYWATYRDVPGHVLCAPAAENYSGDHQLFEAGCRDAKSRLA